MSLPSTFSITRKNCGTEGHRRDERVCQKVPFYIDREGGGDGSEVDGYVPAANCTVPKEKTESLTGGEERTE